MFHLPWGRAGTVRRSYAVVPLFHKGTLQSLLPPTLHSVGLGGSFWFPFR